MLETQGIKRICAGGMMLLWLMGAVLQAESRPKVGLVLSGGGAKGLAHLGTLKLLDELNIPVDFIVGTSVGGIIGALYAIGYSGGDIERMIDNIDWQQLFSDNPRRSLIPFFQKRNSGAYQLNFGLSGWIPEPAGGLIFGRNLYFLFSDLTFPFEYIGDFDRLPTPFRCVAVDLTRGEQIILKSGSLAKAMLATAAIPSLFVPVEWGESLLIDGGVLNNLPVDVAVDMGADIIIAVDLSTPLKAKSRLKTPVDILSQTVALVEAQHKQANLKKIDILIRPDTTGFNSMDFFSEVKRLNLKISGEKAAENARSRLQKLAEELPPGRNRGIDIRKIINSEPVLHKVKIQGQEKLSRALVSELLDLKIGGRLNAGILRTRLQKMYNTGLFARFYYEIRPLDKKGKRIELHLFVREQPLRKLDVGFHYDDHYKSVANLRVLAANAFLPGLRFENEITLPGLIRIYSRLSYPSKNLQGPVYPFFDIGFQNTPVNLFDPEGKRIYRYFDRFWTTGIGLGFNFSPVINLEVRLSHEAMNVRQKIGTNNSEFPIKTDQLRQIRSRLVIDTLDDRLIPSAGLYLEAAHEIGKKWLGSELEYRRTNLSSDFYLTYRKRHTFRIHGFYGSSAPGLPFYKYFNQGRPSDFLGMEYDQLAGEGMKVIRLGYRLNIYKRMHLKLIGNLALDLKQAFPVDNIHAERLWGSGMGVLLDTPLGPLEVLYGFGSRSLTRPEEAQGVFYLKFGARIK